MEKLADILFTVPNLIIVLAVWSLLTTARKVFIVFFTKPLVNRLLPVYPLVLCTIANFIPGVQDQVVGVGNLILMGLIQGMMVGQAHKIITQAGMGHGIPVNYNGTIGDVTAVTPTPATPVVSTTSEGAH